MLRIKDRFVHHFRDVELSDREKTVSRNFSSPKHRGTKDMSISVLEFIKKPPRSPQASVVRLRVEKNWTHLLRSLAPFGLNMENPKEYRNSTKPKK
jgi:transposase-like protein